MAIYCGVDGIARKVKKMYVGVDGKARKVKRVYCGDANGKANLVWWLPNLAIYDGTIEDRNVDSEYTYSIEIRPVGGTIGSGRGLYGIFAGGTRLDEMITYRPDNDDYESSDAVTAYDRNLTKYSPDKMAVERECMSIASCSDHCFIAGGNTADYTGEYGTYSTIIDVYNTKLTHQTIDMSTVSSFSAFYDWPNMFGTKNYCYIAGADQTLYRINSDLAVTELSEYMNYNIRSVCKTAKDADGNLMDVFMCLGGGMVGPDDGSGEGTINGEYGYCDADREINAEIFIWTDNGTKIRNPTCGKLHNEIYNNSSNSFVPGSSSWTTDDDGNIVHGAYIDGANGIISIVDTAVPVSGTACVGGYTIFGLGGDWKGYTFAIDNTTFTVTDLLDDLRNSPMDVAGSETPNYAVFVSRVAMKSYQMGSTTDYNTGYGLALDSYDKNLTRCTETDLLSFNRYIYGGSNYINNLPALASVGNYILSSGYGTYRYSSATTLGVDAIYET